MIFIKKNWKCVFINLNLVKCPPSSTGWPIAYTATRFFTLPSSYGEMGGFSKFLALVWSSDVKLLLPPLSSKWHVRSYSKRLCRSWCKTSHFWSAEIRFLCAYEVQNSQLFQGLRPWTPWGAYSAPQTPSCNSRSLTRLPQPPSNVKVYATPLITI